MDGGEIEDSKDVIGSEFIRYLDSRFDRYKYTE
jgi:hypothetical protein